MNIGKIVVGVDFSRESDQAAEQAATVARHTGAQLVLVHVGTVIPEPNFEAQLKTTGPAQKAYQQMLSDSLAYDRERLEELRRRILKGGVEVSHCVTEGFADTAICEVSASLEADLTVVGTQGRTGLKRVLLGSVAEKVVRLCKNPVMVARPGGRTLSGGFRRILVPTDFSASARSVLEAALALVVRGGEVDVLYAWHLPPFPSGYYAPPSLNESLITPLGVQMEAEARKQADELLAQFRDAPAEIEFSAVHGPASDVILDQASGYDLVVMGSHGRRGMRRFLIGSVAEVVVRHAPCSVVVVHHEEEREGEK